MTDDYKLEKSVWDDGDFDQMGWHDATIHGIAFGPGAFELCVDIDYIFQWVHPVEGEEFFQFWVAPCTLVFQNVHDLCLEANPYGRTQLSVADVRRTDPRRPKNADHIGKELEWMWILACHNGELSFRSVGFKQYVRKKPMLTPSQFLDWAQRGGISFEARSL